MSPTTYHTLTGPCEGQIREKASRFHAFCIHVETAEEAEAFVQKLWKAYHDATHICYAYRIGAGGETFRAVDDGEPAHSAGDPILGELKSRNLTFVLAAVVRYYGGTNLGVGGLISAYRLATATALDSGEIITVQPTTQVRIRFPYHRTSEVNRIIHQFQLKVAATDFSEDSGMTLEVRLHDLQSLRQRLTELGISDDHGS